MTYRLIGFISVAAILGCVATAVAQDSRPALFTAEQAQQGGTLYAAQCAVCHGAQLEGNVGPALTGNPFHQMAASQHLTPKSLLDVTSKSMPMTAPGTLKPDQYAALVAFILQRSGYPAGNQALTKDSANLDGLDLGIDPDALATGGGPTASAMRLATSGVFTEAQAAHGEALYTDNCAQCHGGGLDGSNGAPPLSGRPFVTHWYGMPVGAIHDFIDKNMPPGNGGALGAEQEADIVAFILSKNGLPAGSTPLPADPIGLNNIVLK